MTDIEKLKKSIEKVKVITGRIEAKAVVEVPVETEVSVEEEADAPEDYPLNQD